MDAIKKRLVMKFCLALSVLLSLSVSAWATTFNIVVLVRCYDGDTCTFTLPGIHPFFGRKIGVRIRGIDTPEIRGKCAAEKRKAKAARDYLRALLKAASRIDLVDVKRGWCRLPALPKTPASRPCAWPEIRNRCGSRFPGSNPSVGTDPRML